MKVCQAVNLSANTKHGLSFFLYMVTYHNVSELTFFFYVSQGNQKSQRFVTTCPSREDLDQIFFCRIQRFQTGYYYLYIQIP